MASSYNFSAAKQCKLIVISGLAIYLIFTISLPNHQINHNFLFSMQKKSPDQTPPTNLRHLAFGIMASEGGWHFRRNYIESWWRPNETRGMVYLDAAPSGDLLPWPARSPPFRVSDNITKLLEEARAAAPMVVRIVHGIKEVVRDVGGDESVRWVVIGDDDSIFFVDNLVDVVARYDHRRHYYVGAPSEFYMSNVWFSFNQGFGGAGIVLSYPLAKALADDMDNCIKRHAPFLITADIIINACVGDLGVDLSPEHGLHQIDLRGDISGFLSSHPKSPLMSLHHLDMVEPLFPKMERVEALRHLMKAAAADESRTLQQTVCHERQKQWTISIAWGYSAHVYERVMPRSHLRSPVETFRAWIDSTRPPPFYMFNTRPPTGDPCEAPHVFFLKDVAVNHSAAGIITTYERAAPRPMNPCLWCGSQCPDILTLIRVFSPATKRIGKDRCECCDVIAGNGTTADVIFRECRSSEIIA
ncbi:hypothetical protein AAHA92_24074 [Salvia divinorum]|uniref:Uncharacterized protein n=1 Tax=Salvia divinorum TaxID=28513 RepID=A0ABD1G7C0_SALDI